MDPSSPYAMQRLIGMKDRFDIAFACDTDHDRHGIVTRGAGLLPSNHYLAVLRSTTCFAIGRSGAKRGRRQDRGQQRDDRSRDREARTHAATRCRSASSGSSTACSTARSASRGEESAGACVPAPRRHGLDDGQGRHRAGAARGGDHRADGSRSRRAAIATWRASSASRSTDRVEAPATPAQKQRLARCRRSRSRHRAGRRADRARARSRAGQRRADRRHQGDRRRAAGSPRGRPAPRTSTRSTRRAFAATTHLASHRAGSAGDRRPRHRPGAKELKHAYRHRRTDPDRDRESPRERRSRPARHGRKHADLQPALRAPRHRADARRCGAPGAT